MLHTFKGSLIFRLICAGNWFLNLSMLEHLYYYLYYRTSTPFFSASYHFPPYSLEAEPLRSTLSSPFNCRFPRISSTITPTSSLWKWYQRTLPLLIPLLVIVISPVCRAYYTPRTDPPPTLLAEHKPNQDFLISARRCCAHVGLKIYFQFCQNINHKCVAFAVWPPKTRSLPVQWSQKGFPNACHLIFHMLVGHK